MLVCDRLIKSKVNNSMVSDLRLKSGLMIMILCAVVLSGCVSQRTGSENYAEHKVTEPWKPDGIIGAGEYARSLVMQDEGGSGKRFEVWWRNDAQYIYMAMAGQTKGWVAIGFEPSVWMKNADMVLGFVNAGNVTVQDQNSTGNYGPHVPDVALGGTDDILEYGGSQNQSFTTIEFKRRMNTGDRFDKAFVQGQVVPVIWGLSDSIRVDEKHSADGKGSLSLE